MCRLGLLFWLALLDVAFGGDVNYVNFRMGQVIGEPQHRLSLMLGFCVGRGRLLGVSGETVDGTEPAVFPHVLLGRSHLVPAERVLDTCGFETLGNGEGGVAHVFTLPA